MLRVRTSRSTGQGLPRRRLSTLAAAAVSLVTMSLLVSQQSSALAAPSDEAKLSPTAERKVLHDGFSGYPRVIRLQHNGPDNGKLIASIGSETETGQAAGRIYESTDNGQTFQEISTVLDEPPTVGTGMCCASLYELPRPVADLPEGTLLRAASVGNSVPDDKRETRQKLWVSTDQGRTWSVRGIINVAPNNGKAWEPELVVTESGKLAAFFSDESDKPDHDQKLVKTFSSDGGKTWSPTEDLLASPVFEVRPGMSIVRRLPNGTYFMVYEVCNNDLKHLCSIYFRTSPDGWDYGDPQNYGTLVRTTDGKYLRHTPAIEWTPGPTPEGTILLTSEMLVNEDGSVAPNNGGFIAGNDNLGKGPWYEMPAPMKIEGVQNAGCKNFSPAILPSADGKNVLQMATDLVGEECNAFYANGPIARP